MQCRILDRHTAATQESTATFVVKKYAGSFAITSSELNNAKTNVLYGQRRRDWQLQSISYRITIKDTSHLRRRINNPDSRHVDQEKQKTSNFDSSDFKRQPYLAWYRGAGSGREYLGTSSPNYNDSKDRQIDPFFPMTTDEFRIEAIAHVRYILKF